MKKVNTEKQTNVSAIVLIGGSVDQSLYTKCLESISWCDEIVKVDTTKVKGSFSDWRNFGAQKAKGNWLLYVDTDEEVTKSLKKEILKLIGNQTAVDYSYTLPRKNIFLGKELKYGGWQPDYVLRLIYKKNLVSWEGMLHEQPIVTGQIINLKKPLLHISHRSLSEMVDKTNSWSQIESDLMLDAQHPNMNLPRFLSAGLREFWYRGVKKRGYKDGTEGIIEVIYQTFSRLISYIKLWEKQTFKNNINSKYL